MKRQFKTITTIIIAVTLTISMLSCKKGDTGPAGPAGANGTNGTNGTNGVANIQTFTITTSNSSWVFDSSDNSYTSTLSSNVINQSVLDKGTIQVFLGDGLGQSWIGLPLSYNIIQYNYYFSFGQVVISVTLSDGNPPNNPGGQQFKVVVIPPAMIKPNVNVKNYSELKAAYNLAD